MPTVKTFLKTESFVCLMILETFMWTRKKMRVSIEPTASLKM